MLRSRTRVARNLRRNSTDAERRLWQALRESFPDRRFRRQHPIGRYVADFACPACKLAIEIDGSQHMAQAEIDARRTGELQERGYRVMRFWANEVLLNLSGVLVAIGQELESNRASGEQISENTLSAL